MPKYADPESSQELRDAISAIIRERGFSEAEASRRLGYSAPSQLNVRLNYGKPAFTREEIERICTLFQLDQPQRIELLRLRGDMVIIQPDQNGQEVMAAAPNPFGRRGRIDDPAAFFGREELLRRIFEELGRGSNLSLIGEREVGKSSLLYMIQHQGAARLGRSPEALVSIDMQLIHSDEEFFEALCDELGLDQTYSGNQIKRKLKLDHKRHILCLDEIEKMRRERFTADARDTLRGLADGAKAPLTLVIASSLPLAELFPDEPKYPSPLHNIFISQDVPPFSRAEARAFLVTRLHGTGTAFSDDEIADLLEQSGRHPGRLQQGAATLYQQKTRG